MTTYLQSTTRAADGFKKFSLHNKTNLNISIKSVSVIQNCRHTDSSAFVRSIMIITLIRQNKYVMYLFININSLPMIFETNKVTHVSPQINLATSQPATKSTRRSQLAVKLLQNCSYLLGDICHVHVI